MRKVALVFVVAVIVPSLVLAWLAMRSLRDQQFLIERQQSLLYQGVADGLSKNVQDALAEDQRVFTTKLVELLEQHPPQELARTFDQVLRKDWPLAQVGFVVTLSGNLVCPTPSGGPEARMFCSDNGRFLACGELAEVYWNSKTAGNSASPGNFGNSVNNEVQQGYYNNPADKIANAAPTKSRAPSSFQDSTTLNQAAQQNPQPTEGNRVIPNLKAQSRNVIPQQKVVFAQKDEAQQQQQEISKVASAEAGFCQLIGDASEGTLARFVDNKLQLLIWSRSPRDSNVIFGAQLSLPRLIRELSPLIQPGEPALQSEVCAALLDDGAKPVALSRPGFMAHWKRPFVATEIGEALPHWEVAVYLIDPARLENSARTLKLTLGLLISILILAIAAGSWLIVADLNRQLKLARQKTDFVSNVSHELKTPLTSIRMFSELLAEGRVSDPAKQRSYLGIITAETARLSRLINNVLDFARLERGEKKYKLEKCDVAALVRETCETFRPHLEANGYEFKCGAPDGPVFVNGDRDALAQVIVNLLSNAEKYCGDRKEIEIRLETKSGPDGCAEVTVLDRGIGVPKGSEEKIFEQFYRVHDSLNSGIQGSGLGLTLARQIARAHGGEVLYEAREGGGSCFRLRLPVAT
jgi:signal transduction histidine kinase